MAEGVAVVVVSYQTPGLTTRAARSALDSAADAVLIFDNGSADDTVDRLRAIADTRLRILEGKQNLGFGAAANRAVLDVDAAALVFLNSDAEMNPEALASLLAELDVWHGRAIVGPRLVLSNGEIQPSAGLLPGPFDLTVRALGLHAVVRAGASLPLIGSFVARSRTSREYASAATATQAVDTSMISGACFAMGRAAFEELGGFDERFFMYFEDADLCRRAAIAGMPIRYLPSAVIPHIGGASSKGDYRFSPMHARSMRQYLQKWWGSRGVGLALLVLWLRLFGHAITFRPGTRRAFNALRAALF